MTSITGPNPYAAPTSTLAGPPGAPASAGAGFTPAMVEHLAATKPWVRLFAVLGFISTGLMVLVGFGTTATALFADSGLLPPVLGLVYLVAGALYFVISRHLNRFADAIVKVMAGGGASAIEGALGHQRAFWKTTGIVTMVMFLLGVLVIFATIVGAASQL